MKFDRSQNTFTHMVLPSPSEREDAKGRWVRSFAISDINSIPMRLISLFIIFNLLQHYCFAQSFARDSSAADTTCHIRFDIAMQAIFISSDTTTLIDDLDMQIMMINDDIVVNGKSCYRFKNVYSYEQLIALQRNNTYYIYGFTSNMKYHGPYVDRPPYGVLITVRKGKKPHIKKGLNYAEFIDICRLIKDNETGR